MLFECCSAILAAERLFAEVAGGRGSPQTKETRHRCAWHDCQSHNRPRTKPLRGMGAPISEFRLIAGAV